MAVLFDQGRLQFDLLSILRQEGFVVLGTVEKREAIRDRLQAWQPDAVVISNPFAGVEVGVLVQQLRSAFPALAIVVVGKEVNPDQVRHLFRSGAADVLPARSLHAIPAAIREASKERSAGGSSYGPSGGSVLAIWSPKGGVGCSLLAANLAVALQVRQRRRTLLADLNGPFGSIHGLLGLKPERTLSDLFRVMPELTPTHLAQATTTHSSGLSVLCAPRLQQPLGGLLPDHITSLTQVSRSRFDITVLDLPAAWVPPVEAALEAADRLLIVVTPDAPAVRATQAGVAFLPASKRDRAMAGLVVNRVSSRSDLNAWEIGQIVGLPVIANVHADFAMLEPLINTGQTLVHQVQQRREPKVAQDLLQLAQRLA